MKKFIYILAIVVVIAAIWLFFTSMKPAVAPTAENQTSSTPAASSTGNSATSAFFSQYSNATLGTYLTDENGMTLYVFANDTPGVSNCTGSCLTKWPPYGPGSNPTSTPVSTSTLPAGVDMIKGNNGMAQFTRNGLPLYYYFEDQVPGDTFGEGVGGVWSVVKL